MEQQYDKFKDNLSKLEVSINHDKLWENIEQHIPEKESNRKGFFLWFFVGLGLLSSLTIGYFIGKNAQDSSPLLENEKVVIINEFVPTFSNDSKPNLKESTGATHNPISNNSISQIQNKPSNPLIHTLATVTPLTQLPIIKSNQFYQLNQKLIDLRSYTNNVNLIEGISPRLIHEAYVMNANKIEPNKNNRIPMHFNLGVMHGISALSINEGSKENTYSNFLESRTQALPAIQVHGLFSFEILPEISLYSGLQYERLTSRIAIDENYTYFKNEEGITQVIIDKEGNSSLQQGTIEIIEKKEYKARQHTYHHNLSLPLGAKYTLFNLKPLQIDLFAQSNLNLFDLASGSILNHTKTLDKATSNSYSRPWYNFEYGIGLSYQLTPKSTIKLNTKRSESTLTYDINDNQINQKFKTYFIGLQYQYLF